MNLFPLCIGLGAALGLVSAARRADRSDQALNAGLILEVFALVGARAGYVFSHREYFALYPGESFAFWQGGLSWVGCAAGLLLGVFTVALLFKLPIIEGWSLAVTLAMPLAVLAWIGAWTAGVGYGAAAVQPSLLAWPTPDEVGQVLPHFPLQIVCAALLPLGFALLDAAFSRRGRGRQRPQAWVSALSGVLLGADLLLFALLRADPLPEIAGVRADLPAAMTLVIISLAAAGLAISSNSGKTGRGVS